MNIHLQKFLKNMKIIYIDKGQGRKQEKDKGSGKKKKKAKIELISLIINYKD